MTAKFAGEDIPDTPDFPLESDIVDQHCTVDMEFAFDHEIPSRPTSRLGFNRVRIQDSPFTEEEFLEEMDSESDSETGTSTCPPLRRHGCTNPADVDVDITTLMSERDAGSQASSEAIISSSLFSEDSRNTPNDTCSSDDEDVDAELDSDCSSCEDFDDESDTISLFPTTDSTSDILSASFSSSVEESDWSVRPKYSCLPSPLSPRYAPQSAFTYWNSPQRHRYRHHGHSRHALLHVKWFWATREDRWMEHKARLCEAKAYGGLSIFSSVSPRLRLPGGCVPPDGVGTSQPPPSPPIPQLPPLSVHPRRGDLCALRDPYSMHIDRYFVGMPMWTMAKTLWMFDVHMASSDSKLQENEDDLFDEEQSENESFETSGSHAFSDDSDSTLVESESDRDLTPCDDASVGTDDIRPKSAFDEGKGYLASGLYKDSSSSAHASEDKGSLDLSTSSDSSSTSTKPQGSTSPRSRWATSWYRRWEVLLQLCIDNNPGMVADPDALPAPPPVKSQRFFIADDWSDVLEDEEDEDEMNMPTGNVLVVVNHDGLDRRPLRHRRF